MSHTGAGVVFVNIRWCWREKGRPGLILASLKRLCPTSGSKRMAFIASRVGAGAQRRDRFNYVLRALRAVPTADALPSARAPTPPRQPRFPLAPSINTQDPLR